VDAALSPRDHQPEYLFRQSLFDIRAHFREAGILDESLNQRWRHGLKEHFLPGEAVREITEDFPVFFFREVRQ
jgi:hypothetical protein